MALFARKAAVAAPDVHTVTLPTGTLTVEVDAATMDLSDLCGFAARRNPKRGYLFVSRVLGRHIPVSPMVMRHSWDMLAARIPADLPGPVLMLGMAETAVGLGHGVHEAWLRATGRTDAVYLASTRYRVDLPLLLAFEEPHSHATGHLLYEPLDAGDRLRLHSARSIVLIDDEMSTGTTFANLLSALVDQRLATDGPAIEQVVTVCYTDWSRGAAARRIAERAGLDVRDVSLLSGAHSFEAAADLQWAAAPAAETRHVTGDRMVPLVPGGRFGNSSALPCPGPGCLPVHLQREDLTGRRILVIGTGEFVHRPFLLAESLERKGAHVRFQSTSRSPVMVGADIADALTFQDNYGDGIPNYLYNAVTAAPGYDDVLVCHETPAGSVDSVLLDALGATPLHLETMAP